MKLFYFVLNDTDKLENILNNFINNGIEDATIIESAGMMKILDSTNCSEENSHLLHTVRMFTKPEWKKSNLILTVLRDEQVSIAIKAIEQCVGDLNNANTGAVFTIPIDFMKGLYDDCK